MGDVKRAKEKRPSIPPFEWPFYMAGRRWLDQAFEIAGRSGPQLMFAIRLYSAFKIQCRSGLKEVDVSNVKFCSGGVDRHAKYRALKSLERDRLVSIRREGNEASHGAGARKDSERVIAPTTGLTRSSHVV
jgi:hypothetical protein